MLGSLNNLRASRDKVIAHNEAIEPIARAKPTWGDAGLLVGFAKRFTAVVAFAYLSLDLSLEPTGQVSPEARRDGRALARVIHTAITNASTVSPLPNER